MDLTSTLVFFFAVIDPIGTVPVYLAVTQGQAPAARRKTALLATFVAAVVLLGFVIAGELLLTAIGVPLSAFQIAGGVVMFLFGLSMIFGESKPDEELRLAAEQDEAAIFPLAIPSIASPGAILAAVLMTENSRFTVLEQSVTAVLMLAVLALTLGLMLVSDRIHRVLGKAGASVISRVMGLIIASVAANSVLVGIETFFEL